MQIPEIKTRLPILQVLAHYGLTPNANSMLCCPFHADKTPSMQVYTDTNTVYCFSSNCTMHGKPLDNIGFIQHKESLTTHQALVKATAMITPVVLNSAPIAHTTQGIVPREEVLQRMFNYFKGAVHRSKPAIDYLATRGLDAMKIEVGYNSAQFYHGTRKNEDLITNCLSVGLLSSAGSNTRNPEAPAYRAFGKECICFALRNKSNAITGLYFRSTQNSPSLEVVARHFYLKDSTGLYPCYPAESTTKLILTEAIIDAATLLQLPTIAKEYSIISAYGTNRLNDEMKNALQNLTQLTEVVFAFDSDEAGCKAVSKYAKELLMMNDKLLITTLELPNKDVNETFLNYDEDIFISLLSNRKPVLAGNIAVAKENNTTPIIHNSPLNVTNIHKLIFATKTATYYIKGGVDKVMNKLTVTLEIINDTSTTLSVLHTNTRRYKLDLYESKQVEKTIQEASEQLQLNATQLQLDIHQLTNELDHYREQLLQATASDIPTEEEQYILTPTEKTEALLIANDPNLIHTIQDKLTQTGIIGEDNNKIFLFVIATSHIQTNPLNALIQGSSGSGKTNLLKGIFKIMPEESKKIFSRCSEKMLYNVPKFYFKNRLLCFEDVDGLGEEALYAWRELVSNGELISGVSYKDEKGNIGIKELVVCGPITSIACTTHGALYADNMSRLFLIAIDESASQTKRINAYQAQEAAGLIDKQAQQKTIHALKNYVRLLQPYQVHNPHATKIKLPEGIRDERRLYGLYLYFIDMIVVLHQYQRRRTSVGNKLIATKQDCQLAKDLMFECIMLKMDELDGGLRQFFERLKDHINKADSAVHEFSQREIREALQIKKTLLSYYLNELISLEYVQATSAHANKGNRYKIIHFDNYRKTRDDVKTYLQGLIDGLED